MFWILLLGWKANKVILPIFTFFKIKKLSVYIFLSFTIFKQLIFFKLYSFFYQLQMIPSKVNICLPLWFSRILLYWYLLPNKMKQLYPTGLVGVNRHCKPYAYMDKYIKTMWLLYNKRLHLGQRHLLFTKDSLAYWTLLAKMLTKTEVLCTLTLFHAFVYIRCPK